MLEDGSWEKPSRPAKSSEFLPIEEVHEEHLRAGYEAGSLDPEELLIQKEEAEREGYEIERRKLGAQPISLDEQTLGREVIKKMATDQQEAEPVLRKREIKSEGAFRPAQGWRGKEPDYKNKNRDTIRKPGGLEA